MKSNIKTLLLSMPWLDINLPCYQISYLSEFAKHHGFEVDKRYIYLETASFFNNPKIYQEISSKKRLGEFISASLLFAAKIENSKLNKISKTYLAALKNIFNNIAWQNYKLVGFSVSIDQLFSSLLFSKWIKERDPTIKIIFGGPQVAGELGVNLLKSFSQVNWCMNGEGELGFIKLLDGLARNKLDFKKIPSLIYQKSKSVIQNKKRQISTLNNLIDPNYDEYFAFLNKYPKLKKLAPISLFIENSRGCPYNCVFCNNNLLWTGYRVRPKKDVSRQMKQLSDKYKINNFIFTDNIMLKKSASTLFSAISKLSGKYRLTTEIRSNNLSKKDLYIMKQAGVFELGIGIESFSTNLLKKMNKGTRTIENIQTLKFCEEIGLKVLSQFMLGFPTESQADIDETINNMGYCLSFSPPHRTTLFSLYSGIQVGKYPKKYHISNIRIDDFFAKILPKNSLNYLHTQSFDSQKINKYSKLKKKLKNWQNKYEQAIIDNEQLLNFYKLQNIIVIKDNRNKKITHKLNADEMKLYLFCDSIKNIKQIHAQFPNWNRSHLKCFLDELIAKKLMFNEDNDYLSLAIRA